MATAAANTDETKLIDLRYGLADLIALCQTLSPECADDSLGLVNLLQAADTQVGLMLHLRELRAATTRASTFRAAA